MIKTTEHLAFVSTLIQSKVSLKKQTRAVESVGSSFHRVKQCELVQQQVVGSGGGGGGTG